MGIRLSVAVMVALALGGAAIATASHDGSDEIHACVKTANGQVRLLLATGESCSAEEALATWNVAGAAGPAGPAGPTGAGGTDGPVGAPGISGLEVVQAEATGGATASQTVACPAGKRVLSGGAFVDVVTGNGFVTESAPAAAPEGWYAAGRESPLSPGTWKLYVRAICANALP